MAIDLKTLVTATPFQTKETKEQLLAKVETLTDDQKTTISKACWETLSQLYYADLKKEIDLYLLDVAEGKRTYDKNEFQKMEEKALYDFSKKLDTAETEEGLTEIRQQLAAHQQLVGTSSYKPTTEPAT